MFWICPECTLENPVFEGDCTACGTSKVRHHEHAFNQRLSLEIISISLCFYGVHVDDVLIYICIGLMMLLAIVAARHTGTRHCVPAPTPLS